MNIVPLTQTVQNLKPTMQRSWQFIKRPIQNYSSTGKIDKDAKWGYVERLFQYDEIPFKIKALSHRLSEHFKGTLSHYALPEDLKPTLLFNLPDFMPYRNFTPIRSVQKRLSDAGERIHETLYTIPKKQEENTLLKALNQGKDYIQERLDLKLPQNYIERLTDANKHTRDEALRQYIFENPQTSLARFDLPQKKIYINAARLQAFIDEISKTKEIRQYYPNFEKTFNEMLAADVVLKYAGLIGVEKKLLNNTLLKNSFKNGVRFYMPPLPGPVDMPIVLTVTASHYIKGIKNYFKAVNHVNSEDFFNKVDIQKAVNQFPVYSEKMIKHLPLKDKSYFTPVINEMKPSGLDLFGFLTKRQLS